jgi:two-component system, OmpR family, response regulator
MNILLVEDDDAVVARILRCLGREGHGMRWCLDETALTGEITAHSAALLIVGAPRAMPDATMLIRTLRADGVALPILMLTPGDDPQGRVRGLRAGADDCIGRDFDTNELLAHIEALARRAPALADATMLRAHDIEMDLLRREVVRAGQPIDLQPREFSVLEQLLRHSDRIVSKAMLLEKAWHYDFDPRTSVVETQVSRLRAKLNHRFDIDAIQTVRGAGYRIRGAA